MDNIEKVYDYIKYFTEEKGFPPTFFQIEEALGIEKHEAKEAYDQLEKFGRIKVERMPSKIKITFAE